jgi:hypothetical protein
VLRSRYLTIKSEKVHTHFVRDFEELQLIIYDQEITYRYAWVVHENGEPHEVSSLCLAPDNQKGRRESSLTYIL